MGSSMSAIRDDEEEWEKFKHISGLTSTGWKLYSNEYHFAKFGYKELALDGLRLKLYVTHQCEIKALKDRHEKERQELQMLLVLEQKYK